MDETAFLEAPAARVWQVAVSLDSRNTGSGQIQVKSNECNNGKGKISQESPTWVVYLHKHCRHDSLLWRKSYATNRSFYERAVNFENKGAWRTFLWIQRDEPFVLSFAKAFLMWEKAKAKKRKKVRQRNFCPHIHPSLVRFLQNVLLNQALGQILTWLTSKVPWTLSMKSQFLLWAPETSLDFRTDASSCLRQNLCRLYDSTKIWTFACT